MPIWLENGLEGASGLIEWCINLYVDNDYLQICLALGLIPIGFWIFGKARESVQGD